MYAAGACDLCSSFRLSSLYSSRGSNAISADMKLPFRSKSTDWFNLSRFSAAPNKLLFSTCCALTSSLYFCIRAKTSVLLYIVLSSCSLFVSISTALFARSFPWYSLKASNLSPSTLSSLFWFEQLPLESALCMLFRRLTMELISKLCCWCIACTMLWVSGDCYAASYGPAWFLLPLMKTFLSKCWTKDTLSLSATWWSTWF